MPFFERERERESKKRVVAALVITAGLLFTGCGSDSGSSSASTAAISGKAIDGYIRGATACLDINYNGVCDSGDINITTDDTGSYTIYTTPANVGNYLIVIHAGAEAYDMDRHSYFTAPLILTAPISTTTVTPITTLIKAEMDAGKTQAEAESNVALLLGVPSTKLYSDYIAEGDSTVATQALRAANAIQNQNNNYAKAIIELQQEDDNGTGGDTTAPVVTSTSPAKDATSVAINSAVSVTFSEAIKPDSATSNTIVLKDSSNHTVDTNLSFTDTQTIKVKPDTDLSTGTVYTLR